MAAATATAAAASTRVWAIKCSRESILEDEDIHEDMFIDSYGDEQDAVKEECQASATAFDGTWLWNSDPAKYTCNSSEKNSTSSSSGNSNADGSDAEQLVVFSSLVAANAQAAKVWATMLRAVKDPATPLHEQLGISLASKRQKRDSGGAAAGRAKAATQQLTDEQLVSSGRTETGTDGRAAWHAQVEWHDRPFTPSDPPNLVHSTLSVEVVPAQLIS